MKKILLFTALMGLSLQAQAQSPSGYNEKTAFELMRTIEGTPFERTTDSGALIFALPAV